MGEWLTGDDLRALASLPSGTTIAIALQREDDGYRGTPLECYVDALLDDEQHTENDDVRLWLADHPDCGLKARVLASIKDGAFGPDVMIVPSGGLFSVAEYEIIDVAELRDRVAALEAQVAALVARLGVDDG